MDGPVDYLSGLGVLADPLKSIQQQLAFATGISRQQAETEQAQAQVKEINQKLTRAQDFQKDLAAVHANPDAQAVSSLIMKYPEFADHLKSGWDVKDKAAKDADLTQLGEVYSAAASGNWSLALKQAQARVDADKAAGKADPEDQAFVDQITAAEGGDENARKGVLTTLGTHIAAVSGPEHFATVYGALKGGYTLDQGAARYDDNGTMVAHSPFIKDGDNNIRLWTDPKNPPPASGTVPAPAPGGFDNAVHTVLGNEGGYNPSDMNGSPTMRGINWKANAPALMKMGFTPATFKNLTDDQAKQIYKGYWDQSGAESLPANMQTPYFDVYIRSPRAAKGALAQSQGDPGTFMQLTDAYFGKLAKNNPAAQKYANAWSARDKQNRAIAMGQADPQVAAPADHAAATEAGQYPIVIPGKQPTKRTLSDAEATARGLPATQKYQLDTATGDVSAIPNTTNAEADDALDPATKTFYAQQIIAGAPMPAIGQGKAAAKARQEIMKEVARIAGTEGLSGADQAVQMTHYKAATQALKTLETQAGTIEQNEKTALANGQQFMDRSKDLSGQTNYPIVNSITQSYLRHTGDQTIAAMDAAWNTFTSEYAKVVAGSPSGAGTLSDSARHEAQDVMRGNYSYQQKIAAFRQMQADMANRMAAIHQTIAGKYDILTKNPRKAAEIAGQTDLGSLSASKPSSAALPKGAKIVGTYQGKRVVQLPNGKRMVEQ